jgi:arginase
LSCDHTAGSLPSRWARDLDPPEIACLETALISGAQIHELDAVLPDGPLYVHLDVDVIDPGAVPGLRYPAPGGPGCAQAAAAAAVDPHLKAAFAAAD